MIGKTMVTLKKTLVGHPFYFP
jgi:hypothetical protein